MVYNRGVESSSLTISIEIFQLCFQFYERQGFLTLVEFIIFFNLNCGTLACQIAIMRYSILYPYKWIGVKFLASLKGKEFHGISP